VKRPPTRTACAGLCSFAYNCLRSHRQLQLILANFTALSPLFRVPVGCFRHRRITPSSSDLTIGWPTSALTQQILMFTCSPSPDPPTLPGPGLGDMSQSIRGLLASVIMAVKVRVLNSSPLLATCAWNSRQPDRQTARAKLRVARSLRHLLIDCTRLVPVIMTSCNERPK
jgi:hypothetical protein